MKHFLKIFLFFCVSISSAQTKLELTPQGFLPLEMKSPNKPLDQLLKDSKSWAAVYNEKGYDLYDVTENSLIIEARVVNGYYTYNIGVKYYYDIKYRLKIVFKPNDNYTLSISVKEIYADNVVIKTTPTDFFTADGKLKDDFRDAKPSLENTMNTIVESYVNFIAR